MRLNPSHTGWKEVMYMKLKKLAELKQGAVTQCNRIEKVTTLSEEELRRVAGGNIVVCGEHAHYHYSGCEDSF